jgi:hypothetical protein
MIQSTQLDTSIDSSGSVVAAANPLHSVFPDDPTADYLRDAERILAGDSKKYYLFIKYLQIFIKIFLNI